MSKYSNDLRSGNSTYLPVRSMKSPVMETIQTQIYETGSPIDFNKDISNLMMNEVNRMLILPDPVLANPITDDPVIGGEIKRFVCALIGYRESANPVIPIRDIVHGTFTYGPEYASYLKKVRARSWNGSSGGTFADNSLDDDVKWYLISDIGDIFNYRYLPFWREEDPHDEQYYWHPIDVISDEHIQAFEDRVLDMLDGLPDLPEVEPQEILLSNNGNGCQSSQGVRSKVYLEKETTNGFTSEPLVGLHSYVQKCPGDSRAAITLSVPHSNTVRWIEKQLCEFASRAPYSAYTFDESEFEKKFQKFKDKHTYFFCRDIKKDGITKVRQLVQAVLRAYKTKYPRHKVCEYFGIYDDFFVIIDNKKFSTKRGVGLGMSSAITTIIQSVLFWLTLDEVETYDSVGGKVSALFYHDDAAIATEFESDMDWVLLAEEVVHTRYQQVRNLQKSTLSPQFVLCEKYSQDSMNRKESYQRYLFNLPMVATNIAHAKSMIQSSCQYYIDIDVAYYLEKAISYWGYEFHPGESWMPYSLGGWQPAMMVGVDTSMYYTTYTKTDLSCAIACRPRKLVLRDRGKPDNRKYRSPLEQMYGPNLELAGSGSRYNYMVSVTEVKQHYTRFLRKGALRKAWIDIQRDRKRDFDANMKSLSGSLPSDVFYKVYTSLRPEKDTLPRDVHVVESLVMEGEDPEVPNPSLSYLQWHNPQINFGVIPCPAHAPVHNLKGSEIESSYKSTGILGMKNGLYPPVLYPNRIQYVGCPWVSPAHVSAAYCSYNGLVGVMVPENPSPTPYQTEMDKFNRTVSTLASLSKPDQKLWKTLSKMSGTLLPFDGLDDLRKEIAEMIPPDKEVPEIIDTESVSGSGDSTQPIGTVNMSYWDWKTDPDPGSCSLHTLYSRFSGLIAVYEIRSSNPLVTGRTLLNKSPEVSVPRHLWWMFSHSTGYKVDPASGFILPPPSMWDSGSNSDEDFGIDFG
jgi:hypothetical protein